MTAPKDRPLIDYQARTLAAAFAVPGGDNDLGQRLTNVENTVNDGVKGNAALNERIAGVENTVNDGGKGNQALYDVVSDDMTGNNALHSRVVRLEIVVVLIIFWTFNREALVKAGITSSQDFKKVAEAKASERKKQYEAMGGASGAGFSLDEFEEACRVAREVL